MHLSKNIKHLRKSSKMTQKELAESIGLKSATIIGKYEDNQVIPPVEVIQKLAQYFGYDLQALMFTNLESGTKEESRIGDKDRVMRLLEKELDRLEEMERELKETPGALDALRKVAPELVKKIEG